MRPRSSTISPFQGNVEEKGERGKEESLSLITNPAGRSSCQDTAETQVRKGGKKEKENPFPAFTTSETTA